MTTAEKKEKRITGWIAVILTILYFFGIPFFWCLLSGRLSLSGYFGSLVITHLVLGILGLFFRGWIR